MIPSINSGHCTTSRFQATLRLLCLLQTTATLVAAPLGPEQAGAHLVLSFGPEHAPSTEWFDGIARHTPEGHAFVADAVEHGFREAVRHRDEPFGDFGRRASGV